MWFAAGWTGSAAVLEPPASSVNWPRSVRIVPSRYPPVGLFDRVAAPEDLEAVYAIEALTNDRLRDEAGDICLVPREERISGPGTMPIMAAFTHPNPDGSRFSDGSFGVYYAGESLETAIAESRFHRQRFLSWSNEPPQRLGMRACYAPIDSRFHDLRGSVGDEPGLFDADPAAYGPGQILASKLRAAGSNGVVYPSVRRIGGECVAVFQPRCIAPVTQGPHLEFLWNGSAITDVLRVRRLTID